MQNAEIRKRFHSVLCLSSKGVVISMSKRSANWYMVDVKQDNLSEAMGFSRAAFGDDAVAFFDKFKRSGFQSAFEQSTGRATLGCSGSELALMINSRLGNVRQPSEFKEKLGYKAVVSPIEYWIGYALGYLQGRSELTFAEIFKWFPLESWVDMYILHEVGDRTLWDKTLGRHLGNDFMIGN